MASAEAAPSPVGGFATLSAAFADGVYRITLRQPPHNILDIAALRELVSAVRAIEEQRDVKAILFQAEGKSFSAGVAVADHLPDRARETVATFDALFQALERVGIPTVARVEGVALGGGCELACFCDWVYAAPEARFGLPEVNLAAFPPVAAAYFPALIGYRNAADLILTGRTVSAEEALRMGLVTRVCSRETLADETEALLSGLRAKSAPVLRAALRAVRAARPWGTPAALSTVEKIYFQDILPLADAEEGIRAFLEKRQPVWKNA